jgi:hypothetical protein
MGLFSKILEKLGIKKKDKPAAEAAGGAVGSRPAAAPAKPTTATAPARPAQGPARPGTPVSSAPPAHAPVAPAPTPISEVDVVTKLEGLAAANPAKLNWKVSIVDLLKLLDLESSFEARKELAVELGCPPELMGDSAKMNTWLHKEVLKEIAQNGGNIPKELLD